MPFSRTAPKGNLTPCRFPGLPSGPNGCGRGPFRALGGCRGRSGRVCCAFRASPARSGRVHPHGPVPSGRPPLRRSFLNKEFGTTLAIYPELPCGGPPAVSFFVPLVRPARAWIPLSGRHFPRSGGRWSPSMSHSRPPTPSSL